MSFQARRRSFVWGVLGLLAAAAAPAWAAEAEPDFEALYAQVLPSVVVIQLGDEAAGSGVLVHEDGYVVTAAHVVELDPQNVRVRFWNSEEPASAQVLGLSRTQDLALLHVADLPPGAEPAVLADSDEVRVGQRVFAVGAPLGLDYTLTTGVVSSVRNFAYSEYVLLPREVIQTDTAINPGNSGGPLFNTRGEVVGIVSYGKDLSGTGGTIGLEFVVPSNIVRDRLFRYPIPYVGMSLRRMPPELCKVFNWPCEVGLLVEYVDAGSLADRAGFHGGEYVATIDGVGVALGGDLIIGVAGFTPDQRAEIHAYLTQLQAGDEIEYEVLRAGQPLKLTMKLSADLVLPAIELPGAAPAERAEEPADEPEPQPQEEEPAEPSPAEGERGGGRLPPSPFDE